MYEECSCDRLTKTYMAEATKKNADQVMAAPTMAKAVSHVYKETHPGGGCGGCAGHIQNHIIEQGLRPESERSYKIAALMDNPRKEKCNDCTNCGGCKTFDFMAPL